MIYTFRDPRLNPSVSFLARGLPTKSMRRAFTDIFAIFPPWYFILLAVGLLDALFQFSDYREFRKEQREAENVKRSAESDT
jgi:hypothetical protein